MAEISASTVMKLRRMTGQGMMDCKKALADSDGDIDKAVDILRKKGLATLEKRAGRETSQGRIVCKSSPDGKVAVMTMLCCETDFVAKSDDFIAAADLLADYAMACKAEQGAENLLETELNGKKYSEVLTELVSKTGEKTEVGDYARYELTGSGIIGTYVHFNQKVGTMLLIETDSEDLNNSEDMKQIASEIAMHITATKPLALDPDSIDSETVEREKAVFAEQVKNKPAEIIEKIVQGKMNKFFAENCLVAQPFVKDDSLTVQQVLEQTAKKAGGTAKITKFVRFELGR